MPIVHIHPQDPHTQTEQLQAIYTSCLRALREHHRRTATVPPAQHRGR